MNKAKKQGFTIIELLVVIAIIGILSTLVVVALQSARQSARDAKRISDIKQMQLALELYYNTRGEYPDNVTSSIEHDGVVYMAKVPTAPNPADGDCQTASNTYEYTQQDLGASYTIDFCLGGQTGELSSGVKQAVPGGIIIGGSGSPNWICGHPIQYEGGPYDSDGVSTTTGGYYRTTLIGGQCWLADNLNVGSAKFNNESLSTTTPEKYCYGATDTDSDPDGHCSSYGGLYTWTAMMQGASSSASTPSGVQGICPDNWHIPSDDEWTILIDYVINNTDATADTVGRWLKTCRQENNSNELVCLNPLGGAGTNTLDHPRWASSTHYGINAYNFAILPAGARSSAGVFYGLRADAAIWSASLNDAGSAYYRGLGYNASGIGLALYGQTLGFSVRCLKN